MGLALSELQRQVAEDRRTQQRQLDALERRLQDGLGGAGSRCMVNEECVFFPEIMGKSPCYSWVNQISMELFMGIYGG